MEDLGLIVGQRGFSNDLDRLEARAVMDLEKRQAGLRVAPGADPALDDDRRADVDLAGQHVLDCQMSHGVLPDLKSCAMKSMSVENPISAVGASVDFMIMPEVERILKGRRAFGSSPTPRSESMVFGRTPVRTARRTRGRGRRAGAWLPCGRCRGTRKRPRMPRPRLLRRPHRLRP